MTTMLNTGLFLLSLAAIVHSKTLSLVIRPGTSYMMVMKGDKLKIECVQKYETEDDDRSAFKKDGAQISSTNDRGYQLSLVSQYVDEQPPYLIATNSLTKNVATEADMGTFACYTGSGIESQITVAVVTLTTEDADLPKSGTAEQVELRCILKDNLPVSVNEKAFQWKHEDKRLTEGDKYKMFDNGALFIMGAKREDMGEYMCTVVFFGSSEVEKQFMPPKSAFLNAGPVIDHLDNNKNMVQGDKLELTCNVSGYPVPKVTWFKDGTKMNSTSTTRIHFLPHKATATGHLQIFDLDYADEGDYMCLAENPIEPQNATATMKLRVKDETNSDVNSGGGTGGDDGLSTRTIVITGSIAVVALLAI